MECLLKLVEIIMFLIFTGYLDVGAHRDKEESSSGSNSLLYNETEFWPSFIKKSLSKYAQMSSSPPDIDTDVSEMYPSSDAPYLSNPCANFNTGGVPSGIITSPNYPQLYPPNVDCYLTVYGNAGNAVVLDFRGSTFNVEEANSGDRDPASKCKYDYLEIRDGPFGFSPLLGKFCGNEIPRRKIHAESGYMWLHFHTDAELQTKGFAAEIKQVPTKSHQRPPCVIGNSVTADDGHVRTDFMKSVYLNIANSTDAFECIWVISTTDPAYRVRLFFKEFNLAFPNNCSLNMVEVYQNQTSKGHLVRSLCSVIANPVDTNSRKAYVRIFLSAKAMQDTNVEIVYSAYFRSKSETCDERSGLLPCGDGTCIPDHLACNGRQNCLYFKDEKDCGPVARDPIQFVKGPYLIILLIILGGIFSIIACAMVLNFCPRFKRQYEKEYAVNRSNDRSTPTLTPVVTDPMSRRNNMMTLPLEAGGSVPVPYELVYSTVVPGPNHASRLLEFMPKDDVENLHMLLCRQGCALASINNGTIRRANSLGATLSRDNQTFTRYSRDSGSAPPSDVPYPDLETESTSHGSSSVFRTRTVPNTPNVPLKAYAKLDTPDIIADDSGPKWHESVSSNSRKSVKFLSNSSHAPPPAPAPIMQHFSYDAWENTRNIGSPQYSPTSSDTLGELSLIEGAETVSPSSFEALSPPLMTPNFPTNENLSDIKRNIELKYAPPKSRRTCSENKFSRRDCVIVNL